MMKSRKTMILLVLAVLAVVLCASCAKQATEEKTKMTLFFVNKTGERVTSIKIKEEIGDKPSTWNISGMDVGGDTSMTIDTVLQNGQPHVSIAFTTQSGYTAQGSVLLKGDKNVTFTKEAADSFSVQISEK